MRIIDSLKARREAAKNEGGFSLIDVVVTVAIIVALSVGGFVSYSGIVQNAKGAAVASAADQVYTALAVNANDGGLVDPVATYNASSDTIKVYVGTEGTGATAKQVVYAVHKDAKGGADNTGATPTDFAAAATANKTGNADLIAKR